MNIIVGINAFISLAVLFASSTLCEGRGRWRYWVIVVGTVVLQNLNYAAGMKGW